MQVEYKQLMVNYEVDMRAWEANSSTTSGTSKHTWNNAHMMVGMLLELLNSDLKIEVKDNAQFSSLEAGGI